MNKPRKLLKIKIKKINNYFEFNHFRYMKTYNNVGSEKTPT